MNEEIEKLLNKVNYEIQKHINQGYDVEMLVPLEFDVSEWTLLLSYIEQLQNNWNELKKIIEQDIRQCEELIEECPKGLRNTIIGTGSYEGIIGYNKYILSKMQELEQGKDE